MQRMKHALHGEMNVDSDADVASNEKNGWVRMDESLSEKSSDTVDHDVESETAEPISEDLILAYAAKFGKPPHHRMIKETIERALKE